MPKSENDKLVQEIVKSLLKGTTRESLPESLQSVQELANLFWQRAVLEKDLQETVQPKHIIEVWQKDLEKKKKVIEENATYLVILGIIENVAEKDVLGTVETIFGIERERSASVTPTPAMAPQADPEIDKLAINTNLKNLIAIFGAKFYGKELDQEQIANEAERISKEYVHNQRLANEEVSRAMDCLLHKYPDVAVIARTQYQFQQFEQGDLNDVTDIIQMGDFQGKNFLVFADLSFNHFTAAVIAREQKIFHAIDSFGHKIDWRRYFKVGEAVKIKFRESFGGVQHSSSQIMKQDHKDVTLCGAHTIINSCLTILRLKGDEESKETFKKIVGYLFATEIDLFEEMEFYDILNIAQSIYDTSDPKQRLALEERVIILAAINSCHFKEQELPHEDKNEALLHGAVQFLDKNIVGSLSDNIALKTRLTNIFQAQKSISHSINLDALTKVDEEISSDANYILLREIILRAGDDDEKRKVSNIVQEFLKRKTLPPTVHRPIPVRLAQQEQQEQQPPQRPFLMGYPQQTLPKIEEEPETAARPVQSLIGAFRSLGLGNSSNFSRNPNGLDNERDDFFIDPFNVKPVGYIPPTTQASPPSSTANPTATNTKKGPQQEQDEGNSRDE